MTENPTSARGWEYFDDGISLVSIFLSALYTQDNVDGRPVKIKTWCVMDGYNSVFTNFCAFSNRIGQLVVRCPMLIVYDISAVDTASLEPIQNRLFYDHPGTHSSYQ